MTLFSIAQNNKLEQERRTANPDADVDISMSNDTPTLANGDVDDTLETNGASISDGDEAVSYTHLTLPTKRIV